MIIRQKDKEEIIRLAKKNLKQELKILAYGSRVNGEAHDTSDLDLVLVSKNEEKVNINDFVNFIEALKESNIPIFVQVLDWNRIPETFHKNILANNEELLRIRYE
jgi:predicted nucleotidyltransferase